MIAVHYIVSLRQCGIGKKQMRQAALPQGHNDCVLAVASLDLGHALPTDLFQRYARAPKEHIHLVVRPGRSELTKTITAK